jgi:Ca2+-binding RTX toxin-like protein
MDAGSGVIDLTAAGSIYEFDELNDVDDLMGEVDLIAGEAHLAAGLDISGGSENNLYLEIEVATLDAEAGSGSIYLDETDDIDLGAVSALSGTIDILSDGELYIGAGSVADGQSIRVQASTISLENSNLSAVEEIVLKALVGTVSGDGSETIITGLLDVEAQTGITLNTHVEEVVASNFGLGDIRLVEANDIALRVLTAADGKIEVITGGSITASIVTVSTDALGNDISLTASSGHIYIDLVIVGKTSGSVFIDAQGGSILETDPDDPPDDPDADVVGYFGHLNSLPTPIDPALNLEFDLEVLRNSSTDLFIDVVGDIELNTELMGIAEVTATGTITVTYLTTAGGFVNLNAGGDILIDYLDAGIEGEINLTAGGSILEVSESDPDVDLIGGTVVLTAGNGIGDTLDASRSLETSLVKLQAETSTGPILITETDDIELAGLQAAAADVKVVSGRTITVTGDITAAERIDLQAGQAISTASDVIVSALQLEAVAGAGIDLNTQVQEATLEVTGTGNLRIVEVDAIHFSGISTNDGSIEITAGGFIAAEQIKSITDSDDNDITLTTTSGAIEVNDLAAGSFGDVLLNSAAGLAAKVAGNELTVQAGGQIILNTNVVTLHAVTSATGNVSVIESDDIVLDGVLSADGGISVTAEGDISAKRVELLNDSTVNHIDLTTSNVGSIHAGDINAGTLGEVNLNAAEAITDLSGLITAHELVALANGAMTLTTMVASLNAETIDSGDITVDEFDDIILTNVRTYNGAILVTAGGDITALLVESLTDDDTNDISLATTASDIDAEAIIAGNLGDVWLTALGDLTATVTADELMARADGAMTLTTTVAYLDAQTGAAGALTVTETDSVYLLNVLSFNGPVTITAGGNITALLVESLTDDDTNDISLTTTAGDIAATEIVAGELNDVSLDSAGTLTANVIAEELFTRAAGAMTLTTTVSSLDAETIDSGDITVDEFDDIILTNVRTYNGAILVTAGEVLATFVQSLTDSDDNNISLTTTTAGIEAEQIIAGDEGDVTLISAGVISDGAGKIIADTLVVEASGPIAVNTTVNILNATCESEMFVIETDGITLSTAIASLTLTTQGSGDVAVTELDDIMLKDIQIADGTFSVNDGYITIAGDILAHDVIFIATDAVSVPGSLVSAQTLDATASSGISLQTKVDVIIAQVTGPGNLEITEEDAVTLEDVSTFDGSIAITAGGTITAIAVESLKDSEANDINLTTTAGDIEAGNVNAGTLGHVDLASAGAINDIDGKIAANGLTATATSAMTLDTTVANLIAVSSVSGDVIVTETDTVTLAHVKTAGGSITVTAGGTIKAMAVESQTDSDANDISLTTTAGDITASQIIAGELGDVSLESAGTLTATVVADELFTRAAGAMTLTTTVAGLDAETTATGNITVAESDGVILSNVRTVDGSISVAGAGHLTAEMVVAGGVGRDITLSTENSGDVKLDSVTAKGDTITVISADAIVERGEDTDAELTASSLILNAATGIGDPGNPLETEVEMIEADAGAGGIWIDNTGDLVIGGISAQVGLRGEGDIVVTASSPLTLNEDVISSSDITLTAADSDGPGDNLIISTGSEISTTGGTVTLQAGDDFTLQAGAVVSASEQVLIHVDYGDADASGSTIEISGQIYGTSVEITSQDDEDTVFLTNVTSGSPTTVSTGAGTDTINIQTIDAATTVDAGEGNDIVNVGSGTPGVSGPLDQINALLNIHGGAGTDTLNVDDSVDTDPNIGSLTASTIAGLGMTDGISYEDFEDLNIGLGSGGDIFTIASTHSGTTTLKTNGGTDTVNVQAVAGSTTVNAGTGNDIINVGDPATVTVDAIAALLSIHGEAGSNTLNVDDSSDSNNNTGELTGTTITGLDMTGPISYFTLEYLNIYLGTGADTFTIASTHEGTTTLDTNGGEDTVNVLTTAGVTTVNTGEAQDTVNVQMINAATTINAGAGDDVINVGSLAPAGGGILDYISALLTINGGDGTDTLIVDNSGEDEPNSGTLTATTITGLGLTDDGITYGALEHLNIWLGGGSDTFTIESTHNGTITLWSGEGDDVIDASVVTTDLLIKGGSGNDIIISGSGNDLISGDEGDDLIIAGPGADVVTGGAGMDLILGDSGSVVPTGDITNPRFRALTGTRVYSEGRDEDTVPDGEPMVEESASEWPEAEYPIPPAWADREITLLDHTMTLDEPSTDASYDDYIAGGPDDDIIFGQLGDDILHGDGNIVESENGYRLEALTEVTGENDIGGDDYIEGNAGNDIIYGGLGQDDIIGGSSSLFGLNDPASRVDGSDTIFGGNGDLTDRNNLGDTSTEGHARDADVILGDNGNIYRLVGTGGVSTAAYLTFNYDIYSQALRIIPRAAELLDYTEGGPDWNPAAENDIGAADEIHGESGDDVIYGMLGGDVLFGEGQDDDIIGGTGHDFISGGTGTDGVIGDDGRIYTSRNTAPADKFDTSLSEPLYGIEKVEEKTISTPGNIQYAEINELGKLKKTVNLTPFGLHDGNFSEPRNANFDPDLTEADDIIFGGWGDDFLHGGVGDDAISGAEALENSAALIFEPYTNPDANRTGEIVKISYNDPFNPGNVLGFEALKDEEFALYDEYNPRLRIMLNTAENKSLDFFLNFDAEDVTPGGSPGENNDGEDCIFGDLGNDWLVGGTGRDHLWGGYGNDLLNADDDLDTNNGLNDAPDGPEASYEDLAYGGAGRDVLIANTGGDRLIDWAGEFNSYIVPFGSLGPFIISRSLQPHLKEFLYDLSEADGCDPTRAEDTGKSAERNGEPEGETGLVQQQDDDWHDQTGAPKDIQPGNIPGGKRDVIGSATFNTGMPHSYAADSGIWVVDSGRLEVSPEVLYGDAVSVMHIQDPLPGYFEIKATINAGKPTAGYKSNAFLIFDYQSPTDFKYAGVNISNDKLEMGYRDATGWHELEQSNAQLKPDTDYHLLLALNGTTATLVVDGSDVFTHVFEARVEDGYAFGLNAGMVGLGAYNSIARIDDVKVQVLPPEITFQTTDEFDTTVSDLFAVDSTGSWGVSDGRYMGVPEIGMDFAASTVDLQVASASFLELETVLRTDTIAGVIFDCYSPTEFKFAAISTQDNQVLIGHHTKRGWFIDATKEQVLDAGMDYRLRASLKGTTVSVAIAEAGDTIGDLALLGYSFNAVTVDGDFGLLAKDGSSTFDAVTVKTNDPAFRDEGDNLMAATAPQEAVGTDTVLTDDALAPIVDEAIERLTDALGINYSLVASLYGVSFQIVTFNDLTLGRAVGDTVLIDADAAGYGWFVDSTPYDDTEFRRQNADGELLATPSSPAYGDMDLLTVVMHELGHVLGFEDLDPEEHPHDLMSSTLATGVRRLYTETDVMANLLDDVNRFLITGSFAQRLTTAHSAVWHSRPLLADESSSDQAPHRQQVVLRCHCRPDTKAASICNLATSLCGTSVGLSLNGQIVCDYLFNSLLKDEDLGLFSGISVNQFAEVLARNQI